MEGQGGEGEARICGFLRLVGLRGRGVELDTLKYFLWCCISLLMAYLVDQRRKRLAF